jgi:uncharacterized protein
MLRKAGLLFVPQPLHRQQFIVWLKRVHAWTGFWGALLFLMLGVSGVLLNHRSIMKIDTGEPVAVSAMDIAIPAGSINTAEELGKWARQEFGLKSEARLPRSNEGQRGGQREGRTAEFMGVERPVAEKWEVSFNHPNGRLQVTHIKGSASVSVEQSSQNFFGFMKNLHKGSGVGVGWVLFADTIAGAMITMVLSGFLLWSNMHGRRLIAGAIVATSVGVAISVLWPWLL